MKQGYKHLTASAQLKSSPGNITGIFVASATSTPTIAVNDGLTATPAAAVAATGTITNSVSFSDGEQILIGSSNNPSVYTMRTALSSPSIKNEVLIGANVAASLTNLKAAVNGSAGSGTTYSTGTVAHIEVTATTLTGTTLVISATSLGVAGNSIATTTTAASATWGATTLTGGLQAIVLMINTFTPAAGTYYKFGGDQGTIFENGLYVIIGGTVDCTVFYD